MQRMTRITIQQTHRGKHMANRDLTIIEAHDLENLIDRCGIDSVLMALSDICGGKADHVLTNWQDRALSRRWATIEGAIGVIVPQATGL